MSALEQAAAKLGMDVADLIEVKTVNDEAHPDTNTLVTLANGTQVFIALEGDAAEAEPEDELEDGTEGEGDDTEAGDEPAEDATEAGEDTGDQEAADGADDADDAAEAAAEAVVGKGKGKAKP